MPFAFKHDLNASFPAARHLAGPQSSRKKNAFGHDLAGLLLLAP
jgi:hypothetical protein